MFPVLLDDPYEQHIRSLRSLQEQWMIKRTTTGSRTTASSTQHALADAIHRDGVLTTTFIGHVSYIVLRHAQAKHIEELRNIPPLVGWIIDMRHVKDVAVDSETDQEMHELLNIVIIHGCARCIALANSSMVRMRLAGYGVACKGLHIEMAEDKTPESVFPLFRPRSL